MKAIGIKLLLVLAIAMSHVYAQNSPELVGAWETGSDVKKTKIYSEQFFAVSVYSTETKKFVSTTGGRWRKNENEIIETIEFDSESPQNVGTERKVGYTLQAGKLTLTVNGKSEQWARVDDGTPGKLPGAWIITGRMNDGKMTQMNPGARRTMKILSGTRFQWIAYNVETKEFSGTGGGTSTTENGKYREHILFFSRDDNRVGSDLQFDFSMENGDWRHRGLSSKGDPIDEVWSKREKVGL
ncbi:membrane or secreted protein [Chryseolinea sp. T2]|uniref:membrane or secreted protein n=1 Tax=Chryseolinea sp. T2 TaxID=3129255 RepID=UPI003077889E